MEFLIQRVVTISEILTLRILIPGILNSGGGNLFSLGFVGVWVVYMVGSLVSLRRRQQAPIARPDSILDDHLQNTVAYRRAHLSADTWNKKKADQKQ